MRKILFVMDSLAHNGAVKSLINLLQALDTTKYEVSLFVLDRNLDQYLEAIPKWVKILPEIEEISQFFAPLKQSLRWYIKRGRFHLAWLKLRWKFLRPSGEYANNTLQFLWKKAVKKFPAIEDLYDFAIAYNDYYPGVYILNRVKAQQYIGWNHGMHEAMGYEKTRFGEYLSGLDKIATISNATKDSLNRVYGDAINEKLYIIDNISNVQMIQRRAQEFYPDEFISNDQTLKIVSVGRLAQEKGYLMFLNVFARLVEKYSNLRLYIIGEGYQREALETKIEKLHLMDKIFLLGQKENPYPYMKACDIYVQPSEFEGYGIAIDEAKILHAPLCISNSIGARLKDGEEAILIPYEEDAWYSAIDELLENDKEREKLKCLDIPYQNKGIEQFERMLEE